MLALAFFGPFNETLGRPEGDDVPGARGGALLMLTFILFMGLWPAPFVDRIQETVRYIPGVS